MSSGSLFAQVAGLALVAAFYPPAMLLAALYLRSERPGKTTLFFLVGGIFVVTLVGIVVLVVMRAGGLSHVGHHQTRYGVRLALGVIALVAAAVLILRKPKPKESEQEAQEAQPSPAAFGSAQPRDCVRRRGLHVRPVAGVHLGGRGGGDGQDRPRRHGRRDGADHRPGGRVRLAAVPRLPGRPGAHVGAAPLDRGRAGQAQPDRADRGGRRDRRLPGDSGHHRPGISRRGRRFPWRCCAGPSAGTR